jgi:hypothetical protein
MKKIALSLICLSSLLSVPSAQAVPYTTEFGAGEIVVDSIKRSSDETVLIKGSIKNTSGKKFYWSGSGLVQQFYVIDVKIQDLKSKKQYEQVKVGNRAVGSTHEGGVDDGEKKTFWARVTAPPKDVKEVSIIFGGEVIPVESAIIAD